MQDSSFNLHLLPSIFTGYKKDSCSPYKDIKPDIVNTFPKSDL